MDSNGSIYRQRKAGLRGIISDIYVQIHVSEVIPGKPAFLCL